MALPLGVWLGTAVQLQQRALDGAAVYGMALAGAGLLALLAAWGSRRAAPGHALAVAWLLAGALAAWGAAGTRAVGMAAQALAPALEGRDVVLTGVVARMPQHDERGYVL